jgi:hypothetical protein
MDKCKFHYIEVVSDEEDDSVDEGVVHDSSELSQTIEKTPLKYSPKGVTIATLSEFPKYYTFRIRGLVQG